MIKEKKLSIGGGLSQMIHDGLFSFLIGEVKIRYLRTRDIFEFLTSPSNFSVLSFPGIHGRPEIQG